MTDRELLEAAAMAAGYYFHGHRVGPDYCNCYVSTTGNTDDWFVWSPLTDDGDALRLAVDLRIDFCFSPKATTACAWCAAIKDFVEEPLVPDEGAATRRAIVRAAAGNETLT